MEDKIAKLKQAKKKLEESQHKEIVLKTKIEQVIEQLDDLGHTVVSAKKAIKEFDKSVQELEEELEEKITEFENNYGEFFEE